jgi:YfiH family protein
MIVPEGVSGVAFGVAADGNPRLDESVRRSLSGDLGIASEWAWVRQAHGARVVHAGTAGIGEEADAIVTTDPGLPVAVSVADCLPVALLADGAAGMAHAGWRGAAAGVVPAIVAAMSRLGHPPHTAVIGPGIGPCCFEVGPEVVEGFPGHESATSWGTTSIDLPAVVAESLADLRLVSAAACTHHDDRFHSYRATGTGERQFGVAWISRV